MGRIPERLQERFGRSAHFYPQHSLTAMRIEYDKLQILNDIDPSRAAAFSGYRVEKIVPPGNAAGHAAVRERIVRRTARAVLDLRYRDYHTYLCGMATGFDLWAGLAVLSLKKHMPDLRLIPVVPYRGQANGFPYEFKELHSAVLAAADCRVCLHQNFTRSCFHERNRAMLDHASALVCYYDGQSGGTAYTVDLARKRDMTILNLCDDAREYNHKADERLISEIMKIK